VRVELAVELGPKRREILPEDQDHRDHKIHRTRDRQLRWLALAFLIEDLVLNGQVESYAEIARMCNVSRARVSRVVGLLGMAVVEQNKIFDSCGPRPISEPSP
jgi:hypothetical protein